MLSTSSTPPHPSPLPSLSLKPPSSSPPIQHFLTVDDSSLPPHLSPHSSLPLSSLLSCPPSSIRWYTKFHLKSLLSMMGIKPRHMHRILSSAYSSFLFLLPPSSTSSPVLVPLLLGPTPFPPSSTLALPLSLFLSILSSSLSLSKHFNPLTSPILLTFSHSLLTRSSNLIILLSGTSGTGKSTLASLLADRLRIDRVIGTDGVRHVLRGRMGEEGCAVLHRSTYRAWEVVKGGVSELDEEWPGGEEAGDDEEEMSFTQRVKVGYHQQSRLICHHLHSLIISLISTRTSAIIEGVHLLPSFIQFLLSLSTSTSLILPFLIYISNETKHRERLFSRSPHPNPYLTHFPCIRLIQRHLMQGMEGVVPLIDNTNVDRSVGVVHEGVVRVMGRGGVGEGWVSEVEGMRREVWGGKAMQRVLRMKVEKRHLFERLREAERERREREVKEEERGEEEQELDGNRETKDGEDDPPPHSSPSQVDVIPLLSFSPPSASPPIPIHPLPSFRFPGLSSSPSSSPHSSSRISQLRRHSSNPSSPSASPSIPPSFLSHRPLHRSSSPPLLVSDEDGMGGGVRSESEEGGGGSVAWSIGGSLLAASLSEEGDEDEEEEEEGQEEGPERGRGGGVKESGDEGDGKGEGSSESEGQGEEEDTDEEVGGEEDGVRVNGRVEDGRYDRGRPVTLY